MVWFRTGLAQLGDSSLPLPTLRSLFFPSPNSWWRRRVELGDCCVPLYSVCERHCADDWAARVYSYRGRCESRLGRGLLVHTCSVVICVNSRDTVTISLCVVLGVAVPVQIILGFTPYDSIFDSCDVSFAFVTSYSGAIRHEHRVGVESPFIVSATIRCQHAVSRPFDRRDAAPVQNSSRIGECTSIKLICSYCYFFFHELTLSLSGQPVRVEQLDSYTACVVPCANSFNPPHGVTSPLRVVCDANPFSLDCVREPRHLNRRDAEAHSVRQAGLSFPDTSS